MIRRSLLFVVLLPMLGACGQVAVFGHVIGERPGAPVTGAPDVDAEHPAKAESNARTAPRVGAVERAGAPAAHVVRGVSLTASPAAGSDISADALLAAITSELTARGLLNERASSNDTAEIVIDSVSKQPTVNAVVFGRQMMAATLTGRVRLKGGANAGGHPPTSELTAESRLAIDADGSDKNPLAALYKRFAVLVADRLAGLESKPVNISADGQPRS